MLLPTPRMCASGARLEQGLACVPTRITSANYRALVGSKAFLDRGDKRCVAVLKKRAQG